MANTSKPFKIRARSVINNGLRDGKIEKPSRCQACGQAKDDIAAHHPQHHQATRVRWLCRSCHERAHGRGLKRKRE